ncbi:polyprenyl synthetase family protein [Pendulispora brunnea]|uniref:Polyprenyl synthetase family protein n=2 Tax=Pendulispora brunnea TaxID=2905690 RepID=A0ABZ2K585_9BACT
MRAVLPVWVCVNLGGEAEAAFDFAVALELLHNASVVLDDIEDGDHVRRGRPAVWSQWGTSHAITAGTTLIFEALVSLGRARSMASVLGAMATDLVRLTEGQTMDVQLAAGALAPSRSTWMDMARGKTGMFFSTCLRAGVAAAHGDDAELIEAAATYGADIGLLFQVQDDLLDLTGNKGRDLRGADLIEGKPSFPMLWAYEHASLAALAPLQEVMHLPREQRTPEKVAAAVDVLHAVGAVDATARWLGDAKRAVERHPLTRALPGWAERILAPVAHCLP